jgi:hypothetical protein
VSESLHSTLLSRLDDWRRELRKSFEYMGTLRKTRRRGPWPPRLRKPPRFASSRVLIARSDRFGDMMLTIPFIERVLAAGARVCVMTPDPASRTLLAAAGIECIAKPIEAVEFAPELVLLPTACRTLRSRRHRERWEFVMELFATLPGVPVVAPAMRRREALSFFAGPCVTPVSVHSALAILDRLADGLSLPRAAQPLLAPWIRPPADRARGAVVLNLSAGRAGESDRRDLPVAFWSQVAGALRPASIASIAQPGDEARRVEAESDPVLSQGEAVCFEDVVEVTDWLGRQRLLVSPETGLCHLARNLGVPMVVLTSPRKVPYFYPRSPDTEFVFAMALAELAPTQVAEAARGLLART